jgi:hypothetical protein
MSRTPAVNPNADDIADRAKHAFAIGTKAICDLAYRLAELAGTGRLDPNEAMPLQNRLYEIWEELYGGTVYAVRDRDSDDSTWDEADNTYSDGRLVLTQVQIEPAETAESHWEHNGFLLDDVVRQHPRETICYIAPRQPEDG